MDTSTIAFHQDIYIFTDVGEEIDDETALFFFFKHFAKSFRKVYVVMTDGAVGSELTAQNRCEIFDNYFAKEKVPKNVVVIIPDELPKMQLFRFKLLQIAPLTDSTSTGNNITKWLGLNNKLCVAHYLMGQRSTPALNTTKSFGPRNEETEHLYQDYDVQVSHLSSVPLIEIGTDLCRKIPLTMEIVDLLPSHFKKLILDKAYQQFVGRVPAHLPFCVGVTVGANLPTLKAYIEGHEAEYEVFKESMDNTQKRTLTQYVKEFVSKVKSSNPQSLSSDLDFEQVVAECAYIVCFLTGGFYLNSTFQAGSSNFENFEEGMVNWMKYAKKLTPAYDLVAMFVAMTRNKTVTLMDKENIIQGMNDIFLKI